MKGYAVTIRYLDPPLHEFLPTDPKDIEALAKEMGIKLETLQNTIDELHETNPMLGSPRCSFISDISRNC